MMSIVRYQDDFKMINVDQDRPKASKLRTQKHLLFTIAHVVK